MNVSGICKTRWFLFCALAMMSVVFLVSASRAQDGTANSVMLPTEETAVPTTAAAPVYVTGSPCGCDTCGCSESRHHHVSLAENLSATTCFNCRTNGSYKFPVPRQYTYFWPGIYSQKTMTEYIAPYRGAKLRSPSEVFDSEGISQK